MITGVHDTMMLSIVLDFKVVLAFVLVIKLHQHLSLQHSHINSLYHEAAPTFVLVLKPY